ncbi:capsid cement protein [Halodurantibacterium flavum]|uniref:Capsid cement protein n=1 Tax=Halodurantibacterium flavum TaxID=1382802 RepID=A0ABW4S987_9RHOB
MIPVFIRAYHAATAILGCRIVAFSAPTTSQSIRQANAASGPLLGVSDRMGADAGGMCDVHRSGLAAVQLGGTVAAGDPLTTDADGRAIKAVKPGTGAVQVIGSADQPGVAGDIIDVWLSQSVIHS